MTESYHPVQDHPEVLETMYLDEDLKRAHDSDQPVVENTENPVFSKKILAMVKKMREGSIAANNTRSKKIAKKLLKERKKMARKNKKAAKVVKPPAKPVQRNIMDF
jgi:hypothetical protein